MSLVVTLSVAFDSIGIVNSVSLKPVRNRNAMML